MNKSFLFLAFNKGCGTPVQAVSVIGAHDKKQAKLIAQKHLTAPGRNAGWSFDTRAECVTRGDHECKQDHKIIDLNMQRELAQLVGLR